MRKKLAFISVLAMVLVGFIAMANPVAADECGEVTIQKWGTPTCYFGGLSPSLWDNDHVPLNTYVAWLLTIQVINNNDYAIENVRVKDRLGGELMLLDYDQSTPEIDPKMISQGTWSYSLHGQTEKVFLEWDVGVLAPHTTATFVIGIGTDTNPAGHQEYTSPGCYELNSGATVKWIYDGEQYSTTSDTIPITVVGEEEE
jgi:hypothetical protein